MVLQKKALLIALCAASASIINAKNPYGFRSTVARISAQTLATGAQTADYLLYPFLCWFAGKIVYQNVIASKLPAVPASVSSVEGYIPGGNTARTGATHLAVGAALFVGLKSLTKVEAIQNFVQTNMPHLAQILSYLNTQELEESLDETATNDQSPKYDPYMTCR